MERFGEEIYNSLTKVMVNRIEQQHQEVQQDEEI